MTAECTLTLTADHNWQAEFIGDGGIDVWGTYTLSGSQITILDTGGEYRSVSPGVYIFGVSESSLFNPFTPILCYSFILLYHPVV